MIPGGVLLGLDLGKARIGVAATDAAGILAYPVETVPATPDPYPRLAALIDDYQPVALVVGLPRDLRGNEGIAATQIRTTATSLADKVFPLPVFLVDERMTTVTATRRLREAGHSARQSRAVVDQMAAVAILEGVLDAQRRQNVAAERVKTQEAQ